MARRAERLHQADLLPIRGQKAHVHIQDRDEERDRDRHGDDRACARADPDDEHRPERRLRQRVEHDQIRVEHAREQLAPPQADGDERAEQCPEQEARHDLQTRRADVQPQLAGALQRRERAHHARRTADDEGVHPAAARRELPPAEKRRQQQHLQRQHDPAAALLCAQIRKSLRGERPFRH